jgi:hypothetical protein
MEKTKFSFLLMVLIAFPLNAQEGFDFDDNPIPFFDLNITDSYKVVSEKLRNPGYEVVLYEVEEDWYRLQITEEYRTEQIFVMWPDNQILEEGMNMNFLLRHIGGQIASFTKFSISKSEFDILVEIFSHRDDCVITEFKHILSDLIDYEITIGSLRFALQYNARSRLGTFSYANSDFFVPKEEWEEATEVWEGYSENVEDTTGDNKAGVDAMDTDNAYSGSIPADNKNVAADSRKNLTWLLLLLLIPLVFGVFMLKKRRGS